MWDREQNEIRISPCPTAATAAPGALTREGAAFGAIAWGSPQLWAPSPEPLDAAPPERPPNPPSVLGFRLHSMGISTESQNGLGRKRPQSPSQAGQATRGCSAVPAGSHRACHRPSVSRVGVGQSCGHSPCWALIWGRKFCRSARDLRWYSACTSISCGDTAPASPRRRGQGQPGGGWHLQFENSLHSRLLWPQNCTCQPRAGPVGAEHP